ncbi:unnamed protein product [Rotaria sp. Silwood1]|nr:unnamed protein product [Rotaria sp. Silwood1]
MTKEQLSLKEISKLLNTQPYITEHLVHIFYSSTDADKQIKTISRHQAQKSTRILNSTLNVRALVLFMMLDEYRTDYVTNYGLKQFYEKYFKKS